MTRRQGMVQVSGTTYRVETRRERHEVVRIIDDRRVGAFAHDPGFRIIRSEISHDELLKIARIALRAARLPWRHAGTKAAHARACQPAQPSLAYAVQAVASLLLVLWPLMALCP